MAHMSEESALCAVGRFGCFLSFSQPLLSFPEVFLALAQLSRSLFDNRTQLLRSSAQVEKAPLNKGSDQQGTGDQIYDVHPRSAVPGRQDGQRQDVFFAPNAVDILGHDMERVATFNQGTGSPDWFSLKSSPLRIDAIESRFEPYGGDFFEMISRKPNAGIPLLVRQNEPSDRKIQYFTALLGGGA